MPLFQTRPIPHQPFQTSQKQQIIEDDDDDRYDDESDAADADAASGITSGLLCSGLQGLTSTRVSLPDDQKWFNDQERVQDRHKAGSPVCAAWTSVSVVTVGTVTDVITVVVVVENRPNLLQPTSDKIKNVLFQSNEVSWPKTETSDFSASYKSFSLVLKRPFWLSDPQLVRIVVKTNSSG